MDTANSIAFCGRRKPQYTTKILELKRYEYYSMSSLQIPTDVCKYCKVLPSKNRH